MGILPVGLSVAWMCREGIPCGGGLLRYPVCHILSLDVYTYSFHVIKSCVSCHQMHANTMISGVTGTPLDTHSTPYTPVMV